MMKRQKKKNTFTLFLIVFAVFILSFSFFSFPYSVNASNVGSETFTSYFPSGSSLGFQNYPNYVLLSITSGNLNSSNSRCYLYVGGGNFRFTSNETVTLMISHTTGVGVKISGDNDNDLRPIINGSSYSIALNDEIQIIWDYAPNIWLPLSFIMGIVGLVSMFGGSLLGVSLLKKGEYGDALRFTSIWVALGIALTVAWLWA